MVIAGVADLVGTMRDTDSPRPLGDREIVGRMMRISKGVGWRGVQPEWCMMGPLVPAGTALALTVRHASSRREGYASCAELSRHHGR